MYILASVFLKKTINTYLMLEIGIVCREFLAFKYKVIVFFETKQMIIYFFYTDKKCFMKMPSEDMKKRAARPMGAGNYMYFTFEGLISFIYFEGVVLYLFL